MKQFPAILCIVFLLCSCLTKTIQQEQNNTDQFPIVGFVENFVARYPNFDNNDIIRKKCDAEFIIAFKNASDSLNLVKNIPLELITVYEKSNGQIMAQFRSWIKPRNFEFPLPLQDVNFDIIGSISPNYVNILKDNSYYLIDGKFIDRIENLALFKTLLGRQTSVYTGDFNVRKDDIWHDRYKVDLGMMYFDIDSIIPYSNFDNQ